VQHKSHGLRRPEMLAISGWCKQHDRHGMTRRTLRRAPGSIVIFNLADHKRVVTDELIRQSDIGL
jgi:hypothetical protein